MLMVVFYFNNWVLKQNFVLHKNKIIMVNNKSQPREKRPYIKKTLITQDELWKLIVPILWAPMIRFYLTEWVDEIDFSKTPIFLDKELKRLSPRGKAKNRAVDVLMRVHLKNGETKKLLLHVEIQGYFDPQFPHRVFQYFYRISDAFQEPIETLVIMIDENPDYRPCEFRQGCGQTSVHFQFRLFKLLDNPPPYLGKEDNPFSIVLEVAWYALKQNKLKNDDDLMALKFRLIKRLKEQNVEEKVIYALLDFINIYLPFYNSEKASTFEENIESLVFKDDIMEATTIRELYVQRVQERELKLTKKLNTSEARVKEEARMRQEEARMRQEEARMRQEEAHKRQAAENGLKMAILGCYNQGFSVEKTAEILSQPLAYVQQIVNQSKGI
jgi:hypothetical protein